MTATQLKTGEYKDFVARLEDGKYLTVAHYQHDEDRCRGQEDARRMLYHFQLIWGLAPEKGSEWHSGGTAGATVHPITAAELHAKLEWVSGKLEDQITSAATEWADKLEETSPQAAYLVRGHIFLCYDQDDAYEYRERVLTDEEMMAFWAWALATEAIS